MNLPAAEIDRLVDTIVNSGIFSDAWLDDVLSPLPNPYRYALPDSEAPLHRLRKILTTLNNEGPLTNGLLPLAVVLEVMAKGPVRSIADIAKELSQQIQSGPAARTAVTLQQALAAERLTGAALFADRKTLRARLGQLNDEGAAPALVVNDACNAGEPRKVGKSYTRQLLAHAANVSRGFLFAWVEIEKEQAADFTPDWLIEDLVHSAKPGASGIPAKREPPTRWHGDLANWAVMQLTEEAAGKPVWMLIDGLSREDVHPDVRGVVARLALRVGTQTAAPRLRLILIDYDTTDIRRAQCAVNEERLRHLTADDAKALLKNIAPDRFEEIWSELSPLLATPNLTTQTISALLQEALKP